MPINSFQPLSFCEDESSHGVFLPRYRHCHQRNIRSRTSQLQNMTKWGYIYRGCSRFVLASDGTSLLMPKPLNVQQIHEFLWQFFLEYTRDQMYIAAPHGHSILLGICSLYVKLSETLFGNHNCTEHSKMPDHTNIWESKKATVVWKGKTLESTCTKLQKGITENVMQSAQHSSDQRDSDV